MLHGAPGTLWRSDLRTRRFPAAKLLTIPRAEENSIMLNTDGIKFAGQVAIPGRRIITVSFGRCDIGIHLHFKKDATYQLQRD